ncbi:hypothetical protein BH23ACT9_BH23ACT9_29000 [soil metagenome]
MVVAGPDGAGKTSLATAVVEQLLAAPVLHLHHRPGVLPRSAAAKRENTSPHEQSPYPRWKSLAKLLYLWADYQIGWWLRILPLRRQGGSVLIERGWADIGVDPRRYRLMDTGSLSGILERLLPRPDLTVILLADAPTLRARRTELTAEEITRQVDRWRRWAEGRTDALIVDAALHPEAALAAVDAELRRITDRR